MFPLGVCHCRFAEKKGEHKLQHSSHPSILRTLLSILIKLLTTLTETFSGLMGNTSGFQTKLILHSMTTRWGKCPITLVNYLFPWRLQMLTASQMRMVNPVPMNQPKNKITVKMRWIQKAVVMKTAWIWRIFFPTPLKSH